MPRLLTILSLLSLALAGFTSAHSDVFGHTHAKRNHHAFTKRTSSEITKRAAQTNARFTFYDVGLGACGQINIPSDFIVALNSIQFGSGYPGPECFKSITISYGGKTTTATIMDECPGCPYGGLDFSRGLFDYFADESLGVLSGTWWYNDGNTDTSSTTQWVNTWTSTSTSSSSIPTTTSSQWTTTSSQWTATTSHWTQEWIFATTSVTWPTTTTSASSPYVWSGSTTSSVSTSSTVWSTSAASDSTSFSLTSSSPVYSPSTSSAASPSASPPASTTSVGTLEELNQAYLGLAGIALAGGQL